MELNVLATALFLVRPLWSTFINALHTSFDLFVSKQFVVVSLQYMYDFLDAMITQQTSPEEVCIELFTSFVVFLISSITKQEQPLLKRFLRQLLLLMLFVYKTKLNV